MMREEPDGIQPSPSAAQHSTAQHSAAQHTHLDDAARLLARRWRQLSAVAQRQALASLHSNNAGRFGIMSCIQDAGGPGAIIMP